MENSRPLKRIGPENRSSFLWIAFVERLSYILLHPGKFRMNGTIQEVIE